MRFVEQVMCDAQSFGDKLHRQRHTGQQSTDEWIPKLITKRSLRMRTKIKRLKIGSNGGLLVQ
jgi:hypothetical protein